MRRWFQSTSRAAYSPRASSATGTDMAMVVTASTRSARPWRQMATQVRYSSTKGTQKKVVFTAPSAMSDDQASETSVKPTNSSRGRSSGVAGHDRARVPHRSIHHSTAIPIAITA